MEKTTTRIQSIEIKNFKNVSYGFLNLDNTRTSSGISILGLYGQNGSGKTALIDALSLLKLALMGKSIPANYVDFVHVGAHAATLKFEFKIKAPRLKTEYTVIYEFSIRKSIDESTQNTQSNMDDFEEAYKIMVFDEVLSFSCKSEDVSFKLQPIIDTRCEDVFIPATKYKILVGNDEQTNFELLFAKKYTSETSRSFIFSKELLNAVRKNCHNAYYRLVIEKLIFFGNYELFIIDTAKTGLITMNTLPLAFMYEGKETSAVGNLMIELNGSSLIRQEAFNVVENVIEKMNIVLNQLVPGLTIGIKELGNESLPNGEIGKRIQLLSHKNKKDIPLQYESEGIKKIISVLQLLIVVYNNPSITVAIDELDSGIFEYLLGELLRILSENGKGQLLFTSHNLRPLETLNRGFIAFTTTNPNNRYIRLRNVKTNNNLRDFYYRDIMLGMQDESTYDSTNNYEIALAFKEAGEVDDA